MKYNELHNITQKPEPKPDTYEAGMALNQLLKIGTHAIKIHNMIDDHAEMEAWVAKKIDLASNYIKSVHGYTAGSKAGTYDDDGMSEDADIDANFQSDVLNFLNSKVIQIEKQIESKPALTAEEKENKEFALKLFDFVQKKLEQKDDNTPLEVPKSMIKTEDAGEGHMSKSQLYQTAKMAIELLDMINKGDDLEGWVQTKLNLAADYLQAVYHYEDYQKLNPYREELDANIIQRHAGIIQKHLDEILERKCRAEDVDTKPGMMRILKKRVNEVEKEIAKENRKQTDEAALDEGKLKDWAKGLAMAGIFVAGMAGVGSINDAINNNVPAIQAMNKALELAQERGDDNLVAQIEKDLKGAKLRLDIGKDLNQVKYLQDKYEKFIQTESLAYESKLAVQLNQQLK